MRVMVRGAELLSERVYISVVQDRSWRRGLRCGEGGRPTNDGAAFDVSKVKDRFEPDLDGTFGSTTV